MKSKGKVNGAKRSWRHRQAWQKLPRYPLWAAIYARLGAGEACYSLARWWKSKGEMKHLAVKTLAKYLGLYRLHEIPADDKKALTHVDTHYINTLVQGYANEIEVFEELAVLINLHKRRLGVVIEKEEQLKFPIEMTNKIAEQLHNLLKDYFEFQVKTGRLPQVPQKFDHSFSMGGRDNDDNGVVKTERDELQRKRKIAEVSLLLTKLASQGASKAIPKELPEGKDYA